MQASYEEILCAIENCSSSLAHLAALLDSQDCCCGGAARDCVRDIHEQNQWIALVCQGLYKTNIHALAKIVSLEEDKVRLGLERDALTKAYDERLTKLMDIVEQKDHRGERSEGFDTLSEYWRGLFQYTSLGKHFKAMEPITWRDARRVESDCSDALALMSALCIRDIGPQNGDENISHAETWLRQVTNSIDEMGAAMLAEAQCMHQCAEQLRHLAATNQSLRRQHDTLISSHQKALDAKDAAETVVKKLSETIRSDREKLFERESALLQMHRDLEACETANASLREDMLMLQHKLDYQRTSHLHLPIAETNGACRDSWDARSKSLYALAGTEAPRTRAKYFPAG